MNRRAKAQERALRKARAWCEKEYREGQWLKHRSHVAVRLLGYANERFDLECPGGPETLATDEDGRTGVTYLNMGDLYSPTLAAWWGPHSLKFEVTSVEEVLNAACAAYGEEK